MLDYIRDLRPTKWGPTINLRCKNPDSPMSALGQKRTLGLSRPKTLDRLDRDQKWSSKCGAPQDRADLNGRPDAAASRRNAARHRLLTAAPVSLEKPKRVFRIGPAGCFCFSIRPTGKEHRRRALGARQQFPTENLATYILISNFNGRAVTEATVPAALAVDPPSRAVLSASSDVRASAVARTDSLETGAGSCALTAATAGGSGRTVAVAGAGSAPGVPVCDDGLA